MYVNDILFRKIIDYSGYMILLIVGLIILKQNSVTELDYVIYWASLSAIIQIPLLPHRTRILTKLLHQLIQKISTCQALPLITMETTGAVDTVKATIKVVEEVVAETENAAAKAVTTTTTKTTKVVSTLLKSD